MKRCMQCLLLACLAFAAVGCVAQGEADRLRKSLLTKEDQISDLKARLDEKDAQIEALRSAKNTDPELLAQLEQAIADRDKLAKQLAALEEKVRNLPTGPLPEPLNRQLMELAASNPDLMTYDPDLGMIRFSSDLTFALGSVTVNPSATSSLNRLAGILNTPLARPYEVRVVGHTDNVPINRVRAQHPTNWHLSVHRAIAVKDVLQQAGVGPQRMAIGGYGEFRPIAPNGPKGAQANRRVEIFLVPMASSTAPAGIGTGGGGESAPVDEAPVRETAPAPESPETYK